MVIPRIRRHRQAPAAGHLRANSRVDWVRFRRGRGSACGRPLPTCRARRRARCRAGRASSSATHRPGGVALNQLFERWGIAEQIAPRWCRRPGVPVGSLVAKGEVALGFQQLSELLHVQNASDRGRPLHRPSNPPPFSRRHRRAFTVEVDAARSLLKSLPLRCQGTKRKRAWSPPVRSGTPSRST